VGNQSFISSSAALIAAALSILVMVPSRAANPLDVPAATTNAPFEIDPTAANFYWFQVGHSPEQPSRTQYLGGMQLIAFGPKSHRSTHSQYAAWGRFDYDSPQTRGSKTFLEELVAIRIDCARQVYSEVRHIWLDAQGNPVAGSRKVSKARAIPTSFDALGLLSPALAVAESALPDTCGRDED